MSARQYHDFYAPIGGISVKFSVRCDQGQPKWLASMEPLTTALGDGIARQLSAHLDLINHLLKSLPWAMLATQRRGHIGAVIEAAEARRAEIYGALVEGQ